MTLISPLLAMSMNAEGIKFLLSDWALYPLILLSLITLGAIIERVVFFFKYKSQRRPAEVEKMLALCDKGDFDGALKAGGDSPDFIAKVVAYGLQRRDIAFDEAVLIASNTEMQPFHRNLPLLDLAITLAQLMGLLGTVVGLLNAFVAIGEGRMQVDELTKIIGLALVAVMFGLIIAIIALIPFSYFHTLEEKSRKELERAITRVEMAKKVKSAKEGTAAPTFTHGVV